MSSRALVSVVIPNHNYGRFVGAAVESVLNQDYRPMEVIVVDNGSTDDSLERLTAFGDRIKVIAQDDHGQAGSRNRGLQESQGEFVALLDADDTWKQGKLSRQMPLFRSPSVGLVYSSITVCGPDMEPQGVELALHRGDCKTAFVNRVGAAIVVGGETTAVIRRSCLEKIGDFDQELSGASGWDLFRRLAGICEFDFVEEPLANYRHHGANLHLQNHYVAQYYEDLGRAYRYLFADPDWATFRNRRFRVWTRIALMKARDLLRSGRGSA